MPTPLESPTAFAIRMLGLVPHATQSLFMEARAPVKVASCGRRWGKTTATAAETLWFSQRHPGSVQFIVAPTADQAKILFSTCRTLAEGGELAGSIVRVVESPFPELHLAASSNGQEQTSVIAARSAGEKGRNIRGHGAWRIIVDETAFVSDYVLTDVLPPMLATSPSGQTVYLSTPFGVGNVFHQEFLRGQEGRQDCVSFQFPSRANPHIPASFFEQQRSRMPELSFRTEYEAAFCDDVGAVFKSALIRAAIDDDISPDPQAGRRYVIGFDPAKYTDRSGIAVLDVTSRPYALVDVRDIGGRDYLLQAGTVKILAERYNRAKVLLDATSHDQMLEQLQRDSVHAEGYRFSNESKRDLIDGLVLAFERRELRIPNHPDLLRELQQYRYELTASGNVKLGAPDRAGLHDDLVTALALAVKRGGTGLMLPYSWLINDPDYRKQVLGDPTQPAPLETDEQRIARRKKEYLGADGRGQVT